MQFNEIVSKISSTFSFKNREMNQATEYNLSVSISADL